MERVTRARLVGGLALLALLAGAASVAVGSAAIPLAHVVRALSGQGDPIERAILFELRLPRAILGLAVGAMLGLSGAALQGFLRNPLAEPSVLGASNGASLGAVIALYFGLAELHPAMLPIVAIAGAFAALGLLFVLAAGSQSALSLILAGIAVGTLAVAGVSLALNLSPNPFAAMEIMTWLLGSLEDRSFSHVALALPCIALGMVLVAWDGHALDALTLGEDGARALGVDLRRTRMRMLVGVAIGVGGAVAVSGAIGFIGLIVPHLVRPMTDRSPSAILLPSALGGAALLTFADVLVRVIPTSNELKLGVVTAFLGVPVFLVHLIRERRLW
ncbi:MULTISPECIES: FecCD family ABC transporter permease [Sphingomonas]|uniref:FecCD family ABC transporter permease n=1 Tax=Sphingomonas TaxID=13687 RepID=UPI0004DB7DF6|nr:MULTISPECIES: iron ABC transporter permease [Sphingomonas]KQM91733.1 ABC transporter permease [Sphingomonas sp. Leaf226]MDY0967121.1 iron ABC transporter permease [Sphingomonas sp. CFBP9021]USQ99063.1 iron ABC transporter permease [Sphingomonas aerolata]